MRMNNPSRSRQKFPNARHVIQRPLACGISGAPVPRQRSCGGVSRASSVAQAPSQALSSHAHSSWKQPLVDPITGSSHSVCVALGKFDAMHIGHRLLATEAANLGGYPCMMSFSGLEEALNLPQRKPITADIDRSRVLQQWATRCGGNIPMQVEIPFAEVRTLEPEEFIDVLVNVLDVKGVVVGANYRFGFKARGDTELLSREGGARGLIVKVLELQSTSDDSLGDCVIASSSLVREYLRDGQVHRIQQLLDRPYAVVMCRDNIEDSQKHRQLTSQWSFHADSAMTEVPGDGLYDIVVCADSRSDVLSTGRLTVSEQQCLIDLSAPVKMLAACAEYLRIEFR